MIYKVNERKTYKVCSHYIIPVKRSSHEPSAKQPKYNEGEIVEPGQRFAK